MRTVIYARYSSHAQNKLSTAQQIDLCRDRAEREGWPIVGVFADEAIKGSAGIGEDARPQLAAALALIEAGEADQLLTESTDRVARHQGDDFAVRERIEYAGARLFTLLRGEIDDVTGTIEGLFNAKFSKDLAARVKRGQRSSVQEGRSPAGLAFGYRLANRLDGRGGVIRGLRAIDDEQAAIVRRIFEEYDRGESPRAIAARLNAEGIPAPRGNGWRASTIAGDRIRGNGMLQNALYVGRLVHFRTSKKADPRTRKARIRANAEEAHVEREVPELRIVPQDLWDRVQERRRSFEGVRVDQTRRPKHLLSGLAFCGVCGGGWTVIGRERWGCGRWRDGRACSNSRSIKTQLLEERVLGGLQDQMLHPDVVTAFVREYRRDFARHAAAARRERSGLERRLREIRAKISRLVDAIADHRLDGIEELAEALAAAKAERDHLAGAIAEVDSLEENVVALHPGLADDYRRRMSSLSGALSGTPERRREAMPIVRGLIERVTVSPAETGRGTRIEFTGRLATILALATGAKAPPSTYVNGGAGSGNRTRVTSLEG